jgi:ribosomal protein S18 acetylase RimI-like enzyme
MTASLTTRPFAGRFDLPALAALIAAMPDATRHVVDYPWRVNSPSMEHPDNACCWLDADSRLVGFAAWQVPWAALDFYILPGPTAAGVADDLFAWAAQRFRALDVERGHPLPYWAEARDDDTERLALLAHHGCTLDDDYRYVQLERPLDDTLPDRTVPAGYAIRPLAAETEVEAYVALHRAAFASDSMTAAWRRRTVSAPEYVPDLDLVATGPDGHLAGFCVCWLNPARRVGQIEPTGVHPDARGQGLSRALLCEAFRRLRAYGAERALVETNDDRGPALAAYDAVGFRSQHVALRKGWWMTPPDTLNIS